MKIVLEGIVEPEREDGGQAVIAQIGSEEGVVPEGAYDDGFFVRLQSWHDAPKSRDPRVSRVIRHPTMEYLTGKRVRVTVEVI